MNKITGGENVQKEKRRGAQDCTLGISTLRCWNEKGELEAQEENPESFVSWKPKCFKKEGVVSWVTCPERSREMKSGKVPIHLPTWVPLVTIS